ncbi:hypothetical protein [Microvirga sp. 2TAF3]|uniref:hypothetical protein n=1 Tax=Microvirga sp. 2TAF3 TaxID=3233014 RepID=UPI003F9CA956
MRPSQSYLPAIRAAAGFALAPMVGVAGFGLISEGYRFIEDLLIGRSTIVSIIVIVAYVQAALLGLPAYFLLKDRVRPTILNAALAGIIVASLPWVTLSVGSFQLTASIQVITHTALAGLLAGIAFWICAAWRNSNFDFQVED